MAEGARRRIPWVRWGLVLAWAGLLLLLSSIPDMAIRLPEPLRFPGSTILAHAIVYFVLGALLANAIGRWWPAVIIASAFGAIEEIYQSFVPGRSATVFDWAVDTVSGALGALLVVAARWSGRA